MINHKVLKLRKNYAADVTFTISPLVLPYILLCYTMLSVLSNKVALKNIAPAIRDNGTHDPTICKQIYVRSLPGNLGTLH